MSAPVAPRTTKVPEIRRGDVVLVVTGKDAGKQGEVDRVVRPDRVVVRGLNIAKRHTKPRQHQGRNDNAPRIQQGGILDLAQPLAMANVMVVCPSCSRPTRVKHATPEGARTVRICGHCHQPLDREVKA
jgi:large subunit ribosomal protein L24